jgi:hypothetical protein
MDDGRWTMVNRLQKIVGTAVHAWPSASESARRTLHSVLGTRYSVLVFVALALLSGSAGVAFAYGDHTTHAKLSDNTINLVARDPGYGEIFSFRNVITNGAVAEDASPRFLNHFIDPVTGRGQPDSSYMWVLMVKDGVEELPGQRANDFYYKSAYEWALDGMPDDLDWKGAIDAYDYTTASRNRAYEALGHVLHLVQDMGQPDHARNRTHPGNYVNAALPRPLYPGKVGFEGLWSDPTLQWAPGQSAKKEATFEKTFDQVITETRRLEDAAGLPLSDEIASGLGPFRNPIPDRAKIREVKKTFKDNLWVEFELNAALVPLIPWPNNQDTRTQKYIDLGRKLLPMIEERGAGLLMLYHDIVNPPPYVESVEISQDDDVKYKKFWNDQTSQLRLTRRQSGTQGSGALEPGVQADVTIFFGPWLLVYGQTVREPVRQVSVWALPGGGRPSGGQGCAGVRGATRVRGAGGEGGVWKGSFTPTEGGTLCIEATDQHEHYADRNHKGDVLDSNPATGARAGSDAPYDWTGYEPGPDLNHSFTVGTFEGCGGRSYTLAELDRMRWGTLRGTWTRTTQGKDFDVAFGGHGKFWTDYKYEEKLTVDFRAAEYSYDPYNPKPPETLEFGHGRGTYTNKGFTHIRYVDGFEETKPKDESAGAGVQGTWNLADREFSITLVSVSGDDTGALDNLQGTACPGEGMQGGDSRENGDRSSEFWDLTNWSWSFTFTPTGPPEHVTLMKSLSIGGEYPDLTSRGSAYARSVDELIQPVVQDLSNRGRYNDANVLRQIMDEAQRYLYDEAGPEAETHHQEATSAYGATEGNWTSGEPDADAEYSRELGELRAAIDRWKATKRAVEQRLAADTERAATLAQPVKPEVAAQLRQLAADLRSKGLEGVP